MAIADLTEKILTDARQHVAEIEEDARQKLATIESDTEKQIQEMSVALKDKTRKRLADNERRVISTAKQEAKLELDKRKRAVLESVFETAFMELSSMSEQEYERFCASLLRSVPKTTAGVLRTSAQYVVPTKKALAKSGLTLTIEEDATVPVGFIIRGEKFEYNYTLEKILADKKSELEIPIAKILFA